MNGPQENYPNKISSHVLNKPLENHIYALKSIVIFALLQVLPAALKLKLLPGNTSVSTIPFTQQNYFELAPVDWSWDPSIKMIPDRNQDGTIKHVNTFYNFIYHPKAKLPEGNVFSRLCLLFCSEEGPICSPYYRQGAVGIRLKCFLVILAFGFIFVDA